MLLKKPRSRKSYRFEVIYFLRATMAAPTPTEKLYRPIVALRVENALKETVRVTRKTTA